MKGDKGYELDRMIFKVKKDPTFRLVFLNEFGLACKQFNLSEEEKTSLERRDYNKLAKLGLKPELIIVLARIDQLN